MEVRKSFELAVRHQEVNPIPYNIDFAKGARRRLVDILHDPAFDEDLASCSKTVDFDGFDRYVFPTCDRIAVLRSGSVVANWKISEISATEAVEIIMRADVLKTLAEFRQESGA